MAGDTVWLHVLYDAVLTCYRLESRYDVWTKHVDAAVHDRFGAYGSRPPQETNRTPPLQRPPAAQPAQEIMEREQGARRLGLPHAAAFAAGPRQRLHTGETRPADQCRHASGQRRPRPGMPFYSRSWTRPLREPTLSTRGYNLTLALWTRQDACMHFLADPPCALHQQPGRASPAHGQAADEDLGGLPHLLPHVGQCRALRPRARSARNRTQLAVYHTRGGVAEQLMVRLP